jgi:FG-GAP-like repeat
VLRNSSRAFVWLMRSAVALLLAPTCLPGQSLVFQDRGAMFVVTNRFYTASVSKTTGELLSVIDRIRGSTAISGDRINIRTAGRRQPIGPADFASTRFSVETGFSFYVRVVWSGTLSKGGGVNRIDRTYEFTTSPLVYEEVAVVAGGSAGALRGTMPALEEVTWEFRRQSRDVLVDRATDDLWTELPASPMGGFQLTLPGHAFSTKFDANVSTPRRRIVVAGKVQDAAGTAADLRSQHGLLATSVLSILGSLPEESLSRQSQFWFYPGYGLRKVNPDTTATFINWNQYELLDRLIPLRRKYLASPSISDWFNEDLLIRVSMYLVDRMKLDGGWPRWPSWTGAFTYPDSDIFTPHSRSFLAMAYLWSYLTVEWKGGVWSHTEGDADVIYNQLQQLRRFYGLAPDTSKINFQDEHQGIPYIAYSASRKETLGNGPKGVLNSHADALNFASQMEEASEMRDNSDDAKKWRAIVEFYHPGSKALFQLLYPGASDCRSTADSGSRQAPRCNFLSGHLAYAIGFPCIYPGCAGPTAHPSYSFISFRGVAAGYLEAGEYEPEFVDAVERAARLKYNPYDDFSPPPPPFDPLVARLIRVLPLAVAFAGDTVSMANHEGGAGTPSEPQYDIAAAGLKEANRFAILRFGESLNTTGKHDPQRAVGEYGERGLRKVMWTNKAFVTDWVPGFWQELKQEEIPESLQFSLQVQRPSGEPLGTWAAYRIHNRIEVMEDFDGGVATLKVPSADENTRYVTGYRDYDPTTLRWKEPVNDVWTRAEERIGWASEAQKYPTLRGDFNGDGKTDLAFPFQTQRGLTVRLLLSNGDGTWTRPPEAQVKWGEAVQKHPTLPGDFDGDGKTDLAFPFQGNEGLTVRLLLSNGDGAWRQPPEARLKWGDKVLKYPTLAGDFNGDGKTDLAFPFQSDHGLTVRLLLSNGDGSWRQPPEARIGLGEALQQYPTLVGDFDGDGKTDLAFLYPSAGGLAIRLLLSNGDGTWRQPPETRLKWGEEAQKYPTLVGDFNGDGKTDLAFPIQGTRGLSVRLLFSNGDGTWKQAPEAHLGWGEEVHKYPTLTSDVDGDGKADLIFPFQDSQDDKGLTVRVLLSEGDGTWTVLRDRVKWGEGVQGNPTLIGDFNGDGRADLVFPFQDSQNDKGLTVRALLSKPQRLSVVSGGSFSLPNLVKKRLVYVLLRQSTR